MFGLFSKKDTIERSGIMNGLVDLHTHILPSVDDGSKSLEESLAILARYEELGVKRLILTPHVMEDLPKNRAPYLREQFELFKAEYQGNIEISLGAEYMIDAGLSRHLESDDLLTLWDSHVLLETSYFDSAMNLRQTISDVMSRGYFVILAHPERYGYMDDEDYQELKEMRVLFQMNLLSITGAYGEGAIRASQMLLKNGSYDLLGSDIHRLGFHDKSFREAKIAKKYLDFIADVKGRSEEYFR